MRRVVDEIKNVMAFLQFGSFGRDSSTFGPYLIKQMNMNDGLHPKPKPLIETFEPESHSEFRIKISFINELKKS